MYKFKQKGQNNTRKLLYVTDIMCNPQIIKQAANILSSFFQEDI